MTTPLFGWIPPERRNAAEHAAHGLAVAEMPPFQIYGENRSDAKKVVLWECSKRANNGNHFRVFRQQTGSCVGNGLGQAVWYLSAVEVIRLGDPEQVLLPFWLLSYGKSREYGGMRGRGDGSFGSTAAKAARTDGFLPANLEGLPQPQDSDGLTWGRSAELEWSDGRSIAASWLEKSRKHLVQTTAQCRSAADCREALRNWYPLTIASNWGGKMQCPVQGDPPVRLNSRSGSWPHQMCVIGWWEHPSLGELFYILNSWGPKAHGDPADDSPPGGFWVKANEMDAIARQGETFAFSQFNGFPAQDFSWLI